VAVGAVASHRLLKTFYEVLHAEEDVNFEILKHV